MVIPGPGEVPTRRSMYFYLFFRDEFQGISPGITEAAWFCWPLLFSGHILNHRTAGLVVPWHNGRVLWPVQGPKNAKRSKSTLPVIKAWKKHLFIYCVYHIAHMSQKKHLSGHFSKIFSPSLARCLMFGAGSVKSRKRLINGTLSAWISKNQRKTIEKIVQIKQDLLILDPRFFKNSFDFRISSWSVMGMQHVEIIADCFIQ